VQTLAGRTDVIANILASPYHAWKGQFREDSRQRGHHSLLQLGGLLGELGIRVPAKNEATRDFS
jgi:hypothetical protein